MFNEFQNTCLFIDKYLRDVFYSKNRKVTRVMFDSIFVGVNLALKENPQLSPKSLNWIYDSNFDVLVRVHAAQTKKRVKDRIVYVKNSLLENS